MGNYCTNCGTKVGKDDNFCRNCGIKIDKSDIKQDNNLGSLLSRVEKASKKQRKTHPSKKNEKRIEKMAENEMTSGDQCDFNCRHCYEEFFDNGGGIAGDFDSEGYTEYYCRLGHPISFGRICEDYE